MSAARTLRSFLVLACAVIVALAGLLSAEPADASAAPAAVKALSQKAKVKKAKVKLRKAVAKCDAKRTKKARKACKSKARAKYRAAVANLPTSLPIAPGAPAGAADAYSPVPEDAHANVVRTMCRIDNPKLREISGLASSITYPRILWAHNDSGDKAKIYAIDSTTCELRAEITLAGVSAQDFESIQTGRAANGTPTIWVGDTGDNAKSRSNVKLYRFAEPTLATQTVSVSTYTAAFAGGARDSEAMIVEPIRGGRVWLVSKEHNGGIYQLPGDAWTGTSGVASKIAPSVRSFVTDAAVAPDNSRVVLRSGDYGTQFSGPAPGTAAKSFRYPHQQQGEAVTFSQDSRFLFIASEGATDLVRIPVSTLP